MSKLRNIEDTVVKFAQVLKEVIKFDVEIVDVNLSRIAGTGLFENDDFDNPEEGNIYKLVLETKKPIVVDNPRFNEICFGCKKINECLEKYELSYPIMMDDEIIGVIGFLCYSEEQKQYFIENKESLLNFLDQIADLIALKAKSNDETLELTETLRVLTSVINKISEGVLFIDSNNRLINYNIEGAKFIKYKKDSLIQFNKPDTKLEKYIFDIIVDSKIFSVYGELIEFNSIEGSFKIAIFDEIKEQNNRLSINAVNEIIGDGRHVKEVKEKIAKVSKNNSTVLITGESGTGKELVARAIHASSDRKNMPYIAINCGAIPDTLLESELFGYQKGSFTGADPKGRIGKFELSSGGTIFLDEIADMPLYMQVKILRVLQEKSITRLGDNVSRKVDVRIITATNKNLVQMVKENTFREDLFYRLNVIPIHLNPLRQRKEDIKLLSQYLLNKYQILFEKKIGKFNSDVWDRFHDYNWPGNIRELENAIEFIVSMSDPFSDITLNSLPKSLRDEENVLKSVSKSENDVVEYNLKKTEKEIIIKALNQCGYSTDGKNRASKLLGIGIATLYRKIIDYQIDN